MILLGIQEDILEDFFKKLTDSKLPEAIIKELRTLSENGEIGSKDEIIEAIKRGVQAGTKDQKH